MPTGGCGAATAVVSGERCQHALALRVGEGCHSGEPLAAHVGRQVSQVVDGALADHDGILDHVAELAHVAGPGVAAGSARQRVAATALGAACPPLGDASRKCSTSSGDVARARRAAAAARSATTASR